MDEGVPLLPEEKMAVPSPTFTLAKLDARGRRLPQAIAHRGYKAAYPENTMGAFKGAVEVGAHAIETDIHLSKDGIVVLSHDADLKRCFGRPEKVIDCDWSYLETLETIREPRQKMPRLKDLLEYLTTPGLEDIWLLLDIKLDNNDDDVIRLISSTIASVKPSPSRRWQDRIVLGCWALKYLPLCSKYLSGFPISHIGFTIPYARQFLPAPNVSFSILQRVMIGPYGKRFLHDIKQAKRALFLWTVNEERWMRWSIKKEVDGVITDDPKLYLQIAKDYEVDDPEVEWPWSELGTIVFVNTMVIVFGFLFKFRYRLKKAERMKITGQA